MASTRDNTAMKVLYVLGIVFITAGHVTNGGTAGFSFGFNIFPVQGFHVAIFLFGAGYFYKPAHEQQPGRFFKRKFLRLIVPLYLLTWVYAAITAGLHGLGFTIGQAPSAFNLLLDPLLGGHAFMWNCPLWFVAPFFLVQIVDFCLRLLLKVGESRAKELTLIVVYVLVGLASTFAVVSVFGPGGIPEGTASVTTLLARSGYFLACYAFGRAYKVFLEERLTRVPTWLFLAIVIALQLAVIVVTGGHSGFVVSWCAYYTGRFIPFVTTVLGIAFWLRICKVVAPVLADSRIINYVSANTFSIMAHQFLGFLLLKAVFAAAAAAGIIHGFDMHALLTNIWYYWAPAGLETSTAFGTVYVACGLAVPCAIHAVWSKIYAAVKAKIRA